MGEGAPPRRFLSPHKWEEKIAPMSARRVGNRERDTKMLSTFLELRPVVSVIKVWDKNFGAPSLT